MSQKFGPLTATNYGTVEEGISVVCLSVCGLQILRTVHALYFALGRFVAEHQSKCGVEFGAIWTHNTFNICIF